MKLVFECDCPHCGSTDVVPFGADSGVVFTVIKQQARCLECRAVLALTVTLRGVNHDRYEDMRAS